MLTEFLFETLVSDFLTDSSRNELAGDGFVKFFRENRCCGVGCGLRVGSVDYNVKGVGEVMVGVAANVDLLLE